MRKKTTKSTKPAKPQSEHIFAASQLTPLAVRWKELNAAKRHKEAMEVLEQIVIGSTAMFERLAQYEDYHYTVDLPMLVSAAQEKVVKWLLRWQPRKGRLFSWFSKCAKNAFRSEVVKVSQYRKRFHVTSDNLEKFYGMDDHEVNKLDLARDVRSRIDAMTCRWGDPQEIGAVRFLIESIIMDDHDKHAAVKSAACAWGISLELSRFFYNWSLVALRQQLYEKARVPFTEQDLIRAAHSYTFLPDLIDIIGVDQTRKLIAIMGGSRFRLPTMASITKLKDDHQLHHELAISDQDPDSFAGVARKRKRTLRTAEQIFHEMTDTIDPRRSGEHEIYGND